MYEMTAGDLLENKDVEALVNTVNIFGVMGKGIALQFRKKYPKMFIEYKKACQNNELKMGEMYIYDLGENQKPRYIINFPTKRHWREKSKLEYIKSGLINLVKTARNLNIKSVAIPALGCKNGGLSWGQVRPYIQTVFKKTEDIKAIIYEPEN